MRTRLLLLLIALTLPARLWAGNTHTATGDAALEQRAWWGDALGGGYVIPTPANLCLHGTSGTVSATMASCRAYALNTGSPRQLEYIEDLISRTITYTAGAGTYWLIAHAAITATVPGWTRVQGTHYLWQVSATQPALPSRATWLLSASVSGTAITDVTDLRSVGSPVTGTFLGLGDTPDTYAGQGLQFIRVKSDETGLEFSAASGVGDSLSVGGAPVDTTGNLVNTGDLTFVLTDGGPGGPDAISAILKPDVVGPSLLADTNFGDWTCNDAAGGCILNTGAVTSTKILDGTVQQGDMAANSVGPNQLAPATVAVTHMTGDHGDVAYVAGAAQVQNVQCSNCISDAEVVDTLTASNYLPLAGGTMTGALVAAPVGISYTASDTNPTCTVGVYATFADLSEGKFKKCENGVLSDWAPPGGGGGSGTLTTIKENDAQVGTNIVSLDFLGVDFNCSVSPSTEVNCAIAPEITRDTELTAHANLQTFVHGIADTTLLLTQGNIGSLVQAFDADLSEIANNTYAASKIPFTATGTISATNVQAAIAEVAAEAGAGGAGTLSTIKINGVNAGAGNATSLDFLGADFDCSESPAAEINCSIDATLTRDSELTAHTQLTTGVHGITNTADLLTQANIGSTVQAFDTDLANLAAGPSADKITFTATGTVSATNVQAAIAEVAAEAAAGGGGTLTTIKINGANAGAGNATSLDFLGADFDCSESPAAEINCSIDATLTRDSELTAHTTLTTGVHGITNTANLLTQANIGSLVQGFDTDLSEIANNTYAASKIPFTATGTISATNVQAAIAEVAAEAGAGGGSIPSGLTLPPTPVQYEQFWLLNAAGPYECVAGAGEERALCYWDGATWQPALPPLAESDTLQSVAQRGRSIADAGVATPVRIGGSTHAWRFYQDGAGTLKQRACTNDGLTCTTFAKEAEVGSDWEWKNELGTVCGSFDSITMAWTGNYTGACAPNLVVGAIANQGLQELSVAPGKQLGLQACGPLEYLRKNAAGTAWECFTSNRHQPAVPPGPTHIMIDSDCGSTIGNTTAAPLTVNLLANPTGCTMCFFAKTAQTIKLEPNGTDIFVVNGLTPAAGDSLTLAGAIGNNVCIQGENTTTWWVFLGTGAVTDTN
jgi:hypothetical protein